MARYEALENCQVDGRRVRPGAVVDFPEGSTVPSWFNRLDPPAETKAEEAEMETKSETKAETKATTSTKKAK